MTTSPSSNPSSTVPSKSYEDTKTVSPKQDPSSLAYIIALITLGAAFGNMFMAGKIRNVMKAEMPKASQATSGYSNGPRQNAGPWEDTVASKQHQGKQQHQQWKQRFDEQQRQQHQQYNRDDFEFFDPRVDHLKKLGLSIEQNNEKAIKARFRELVMQYHPDRVTDEVLKEKHQQRFQEINHSYQCLLKYLLQK